MLAQSGPTAAGRKARVQQPEAESCHGARKTELELVDYVDRSDAERELTAYIRAGARVPGRAQTSPDRPEVTECRLRAN